MSLPERLAAVASSAQLSEATKIRSALPDEWKPGFTWDPDKGGTITTGPMEASPDDGVWKHLIADWGMNPETVEVIPGSVGVRGWDVLSKDGTTRRMLHYKARIQARTGFSQQQDYEALYREVRKAARPSKVFGGDKTLLVCLSDFQVGNPDGEGLEGQVRALSSLVGAIPARLKALRKAGVEIKTLCIAGMGDLMEGTCGNYSAQKFRVEIDRREQIKIVRLALRDILMEAAKNVDLVNIVCVPGNHGENRDAGKAYTRVGDNDDVAVFEQVADIMSMGSAYDHFKWLIPNDQIAVAIDLSGVQVGFTHGHVARGSGKNAAEILWAWWKNQSHGRAYPGIADAEVLISGHYHHLNVKEQTGRSLFICPSLTSVGEYFADGAGVNTKPGTLSMVIGGEGVWSDLCLL